MEIKTVSFVQNSFFILVSLLIRALTNFLIGVGIARFYGPEAFGQFSIAFTVSNICLTVADFGFDILLTTEIASQKQNAVIISKKYFSVKILLAFLSSVLMISIASFMPFSETSKNLIYALILFMILTTITNFFFSFFRGFEKFNFETIVSLIMNIFLLLSIVLTGLFKIKLIYLMFFFIASRLLGVLVSYDYSKKIIKINFLIFDFSDLRKETQKVLIYGLNFIFGNLFFQIDTILVGSFFGDTQAGIYRSAFWIMILFLMIPDVVINSVMPTLSKYYFDDKRSWKFIGKVVFKLLFVIIIPVSIFIYLFPDFIISIVYGKENYDSAIEILKIFSFIIFIRFFVEPFGLMITTSQKQYKRTLIVIIATVLIVFMNLIFAKKYGLVSVAYIALITNLLVGLGYILTSKVELKGWIFNRHSFYLIILSIIYFIIVNSLNNILIMLITSIPFLLLTFIYFFDDEEKKYLLENFKIKH